MFIADVPAGTDSLTVDSVLGPHIYVFYAAFVISFIFTPVMRLIAIHYNIVDQPDRIRKIHSQPVAYLGGIAVFMGWLAGLALSQVHISNPDPFAGSLPIRASVIIGAVVIVTLGLWDDIKRLSPWVKIGGQCAAGLLLVREGVGTHCLGPIFSPINQHLAAVGWPIVPALVQQVASGLVAVAMVVGCCNATNLMDGLDGLCGGVTAIIAAGFLFLAINIATVGVDSQDPQWNAVRIVLALALLGAVLGFVPYNFNPASIFMGDAGSMFLGYACATIILLLAQSQSRWFLAAMVMFALPIMDTALAFARRFVNRRPLFSADRHHFHHQLVDRGLSVRLAVLLSYLLTIFFTLLGALVVYMRSRYAGAVYLVVFGSIIVAAYKMGMVHEKTRVVKPTSLADTGTAVGPSEVETQNVLEIRGSSTKSMATASHAAK